MAPCGLPNWQESTFAKHEATRLREHLLAATAYNARQRKETVPQVKLMKLFKMCQVVLWSALAFPLSDQSIHMSISYG